MAKEMNVTCNFLDNNLTCGSTRTYHGCFAESKDQIRRAYM